MENKSGQTGCLLRDVTIFTKMTILNPNLPQFHRSTFSFFYIKLKSKILILQYNPKQRRERKWGDLQNLQGILI